MGIHQIVKIADYVRYLQENSQELDLLFKELLMGRVFSAIPPAGGVRKKILPALDAPPRRRAMCCARVVPGCSTGEERISLAMVFKEVMDKLKPRKKSRSSFFATDLDKGRD